MALSKDDKRDILAKVPLFKALGPRDLERIVSLARVEELKKREILCTKGESGAQVYVVAGGPEAAGGARAFTEGSSGRRSPAHQHGDC